MPRSKRIWFQWVKDKPRVAELSEMTRMVQDLQSRICRPTPNAGFGFLNNAQ